MAEEWVVLTHPEIELSRQVTTRSAAKAKMEKGWVEVPREKDDRVDVVTRAEAFKKPSKKKAPKPKSE